jgi:DNA-binding NtrC family response regulator
MTLRILIADDERAARFGMARALARDDYQITEAADGREALEAIRGTLPDLVFLDLTMPGLDGQAVLRELATDGLPCELVVVTANDRIEAAVECMRLGAADYLTKPFEVEQLRAAARRCARRVELERRVRELQNRLDERRAFGALVGISRPMQELYDQIERVAPAPVAVLIRGETGTGKELIAREIHRRSGRSSGPFVGVNTAAIAESLAESALFGHVRGAFTGAVESRQGFFEQAHGGTLFLDEVGDMPLPAQAKILRALQERTVQPVGSSRPVAVDVRLVSATHQDLPRAIAEGHFRQDLYYRIKGVELLVPPLRGRHEDIVLLAHYFLDRLSASWAAQPSVPSVPSVPRLSATAMNRLLSYPWPGNVRELEHTITAAVTLASGAEVGAADLRLPAQERALTPAPLDFTPFEGLPLTEAKEQLVEAFERVAITAALERHEGNISAAARQLGVHRQSLQQKMAQLGIVRKA